MNKQSVKPKSGPTKSIKSLSNRAFVGPREVDKAFLNKINAFDLTGLSIDELYVQMSLAYEASYEYAVAVSNEIKRRAV